MFLNMCTTDNKVNLRTISIICFLSHVRTWYEAAFRATLVRLIVPRDGVYTRVLSAR